jgi:RHS repeat-associated protein
MLSRGLSHCATATVNGSTVNPTYDDQDRLLTYGSTTFTYTANGELRTKTDASGTTTYTYDAMGSLIAVNLPDGRLIEYVTDGKGRRIGKMVNGVLVKQWLYRDQLKPVAELDGAGNLVSEFIYGTKANTPDLVVRGGVTYRVVSDQLGSPVLAINTANSSDVPFQATYAAFGEKTLFAGTDDWMPFGFAAGLYDSDTKLSRFGLRDYDARIGRWLSKDPIRFRGGQANIYVYVDNDPVNDLDPNGRGALSFLRSCWKKLLPLRLLNAYVNLMKSAAEKQKDFESQCQAMGLSPPDCCEDSSGFPYRCNDDQDSRVCSPDRDKPECSAPPSPQPDPGPNMCETNQCE